MSPSTAAPPGRRTRARGSGVAATRRRQVIRRRRRRRALVAVVLLVAAGVVVVLTAPLARKAVNDLGLPLRYASIVRQQAAAKRLDPALVAGVIYAETKFDPRTSPTGAEGLMQIEPATAEFLAHRSGATNFTTSDLSTPQVNIAYGTYYLRYLLDEYHDSKVLALAAYNGGEANVDRWVRAHGGHLKVSEIPFPETRDYVGRVLRAQTAYRRRYARQLGYG